MVTHTLNRILIYFFLMSVMPMTTMGAIQRASLEAGAPCTGEACLSGPTAARINGFEGLKRVSYRLQKVNIFGSDDRYCIDKSQQPNPFAAIGMVESEVLDYSPDSGKPLEQTGSATAFLVSPCLALTNRHAVLGSAEKPDPNEFNQPEYRSKFYFGTKRNTLSEVPIEGTLVAVGNYNFTTLDRGEDWALVKLNKCVGNDLGWFDLVALEDRKSAKQVIMPGYAMGAGKLRVDFKCSLRSFDYEMNFGWKHDCANEPGSSGAPLISVETDGPPKVYAMNWGNYEKSAKILPEYTDSLSQFANGAVDMRHILNRIEDLIYEDISENAKYDQNDMPINRIVSAPGSRLSFNQNRKCVSRETPKSI